MSCQICWKMKDVIMIEELCLYKERIGGKGNGEAKV